MKCVCYVSYNSFAKCRSSYFNQNLYYYEEI